MVHQSLGLNKLEKYPNEYQPGGMGILITNLLAHWALSPGADKTGMGHWCWAHLHSQANQHIQIIFLYWPFKSKGPTTTYQQQVWALAKLHCNQCPKHAIIFGFDKRNSGMVKREG